MVKKANELEKSPWHCGPPNRRLSTNRLFDFALTNMFSFLHSFLFRAHPIKRQAARPEQRRECCDARKCANLKRKKSLTRLHYVINLIQSSGRVALCTNSNWKLGLRGGREKERAELYVSRFALSVTRPFEFVISCFFLLFSFPIIHCSRRLPFNEFHNSKSSSLPVSIKAFFFFAQALLEIYLDHGHYFCWKLMQACRRSKTGRWQTSSSSPHNFTQILLLLIPSASLSICYQTFRNYFFVLNFLMAICRLFRLRTFGECVFFLKWEFDFIRFAVFSEASTNVNHKKLVTRTNFHGHIEKDEKKLGKRRRKTFPMFVCEWKRSLTQSM